MVVYPILLTYFVLITPETGGLVCHDCYYTINSNTPQCAESEGFEPPLPFSKTVFKTAAINLSANSLCLSFFYFYKFFLNVRNSSLTCSNSAKTSALVGGILAVTLCSNLSIRESIDLFKIAI